MKITYEGTPEEIKELMSAMGAEFPNSTESKYTDGPAEDTTSLKKGDRAKLLSTKGALSGFTAGEEVIVRNLKHWGRHELEVEGVSHGKIGFTDADNLEKITFEVGDCVRTLVDGEFEDIEAGEIGEVTAIDAGIGDGDPYSIEVTVGDEGDFFRPQDLELVAGEVEEETERPTVGDVVKVVRDESGHRAKIGDVVTIVEDEHDDHPYKCKFLDGTHAGWLHESEVEKISEEKAQYEQAIKWAKIGRKPGEYKKGDIVRVTEKFGYSKPVGAVTEVKSEEGELIYDEEYAYRTRDIELIAPVESRVDSDAI